MLMMEAMQGKNVQSGMTSQDIINYENKISELNKKIEILETAGAQNSKGDQNASNLDFLVYHKFNKNLKDRFEFISKI